MSTINYEVKIVSGKFTIDGAVAPKLTFRDGDTYVFDQADSSNSGHILQFSATSNNSGSSEYTTGVTKTGTAGSSGAKTTIITSGSTTDTLYYYSSGGGDHGSEFSNTGYNTTAEGILKPIVGSALTEEKWGGMINHSIDQIVDKTVPKSGGTFSGNVVMSGTANQLGTVTTGNLSNSAIVYPAGHIIQIVNNVYSAESSDQITGNTSFTRVVKSGSYDWGATINNVGASNHVMIIASFQGNYYKDSFVGSTVDDLNNAGGFGFFRETTAILTPNSASNYFHMYTSATVTYLNLDRQHTITWIDESPATGTNNYYLGYVAGAPHTKVSVQSTGTREPFRMTLLEIQR